MLQISTDSSCSESILADLPVEKARDKIDEHVHVETTEKCNSSSNSQEWYGLASVLGLLRHAAHWLVTVLLYIRKLELKKLLINCRKRVT